MTLQQLDITSCPLTGSNLIEASAGTGKTYTIAALFLRLIVEKGLSVDEILVVTFTRAATQELRQRLYATLQQARACFQGNEAQESYMAYLRDHGDLDLAEKERRIGRALRDFDEAGIYTIHSFCQRMLVEHAFASSSLHDIEVTADQAQFIMEAVRDFWRWRVTSAPLEMMETLTSLGLDGLLGLFRCKERNPDLVIKGTTLSPNAEQLQAAAQALQRSIVALKQSWPATVEEAESYLQLERKLLKNYQKRWVTGAAAKILAWQQSNTVVVDDDLRKALNWFSLEKIEEKAKSSEIPDHPIFSLVSAVLATQDTLVSLQKSFLVALQQEMFCFVEQRLTASKAERGLYAFNDFLVAMCRQLQGGSGGGALGRAVRKRFHAALIDEFQDTDPLQYAIFDTLFGKAQSILFLIGDPKQAIYSFRGADIYAYLAAARAVEHRYTLPTNYRSDGDLVTAVNAVFAPDISTNPFAEDEIRFQAVDAHSDTSALTIAGESGAGLHIWCPAKDQVEKSVTTVAELLPLTGQAIAVEISRLLLLAGQGQASLPDKDGGRRPLQPGDFAVLVRNKVQMSLVAQVLAEAGIPAVQSSSISIFASDEALFMELLLASLAEPDSLPRLKAVLAHPVFGLAAHEIQQHDEDGWQQWSGVVRGYVESFYSHGFLGFFRELLKTHKIKPRLLARRFGERCLTNLIHLAEIIHGRQQQSGFSPGLLQGWLASQRLDELQRQEESEQRMESDENAVQIVTIHKSKGLEYPIVFAPFVWGRSESRDSLCHEDGQVTLFLDDEEFAGHQNQALQESLSENLRLFYVALTRARHRCYTLWTKFGGHSRAHSAAPAYLFHGGSTCLKEDDPLKALKKQYDKCANVEDVAAHLHQLFNDQPMVSITPLPSGTMGHGQKSSMADTALSSLALPTLSRNSWQVASFSSLTRHGHDRWHDDDITLLPPDVGAAEPESSAELSIHTFTKGARAGTFLHEVLEYVDFADVTGFKAEGLIRDGLQRYGFGGEFQGVVQEMLISLVAQPLAGFSLSQVVHEQRFNEMEFYFPLRQITPAELADLFQISADQVAGGLFALQSKELDFSPCHGYLHGFIDLVFEQDGRYYLADWKSNYLGPDSASYELSALNQAMADSSYYLQYHLYTLALHLHLQATVVEYDYERDFGGVYYLFLRGIDPDQSGQRGVFFDRPSVEMVLEMEKVLINA